MSAKKFQIIAVSFILTPQNFIIYHLYMQWPAKVNKEVVSSEILQIKILFPTRNCFVYFCDLLSHYLLAPAKRIITTYWIISSSSRIVNCELISSVSIGSCWHISSMNGSMSYPYFWSMAILAPWRHSNCLAFITYLLDYLDTHHIV